MTNIEIFILCGLAIILLLLILISGIMYIYSSIKKYNKEVTNNIIGIFTISLLILLFELVFIIVFKIY